MSDLGHIDTVSRTVGGWGRQTSSTEGGDMSELQDFNQRVIREFRANQGRVSGQLANMPVLLLTMTGARSGRTLTTPLVYTALHQKCSLAMLFMEKMGLAGLEKLSE